ncbi:MAG: TolC family protein [Flavobacteriaceae bacterium]|nr:TolC family protein [Flavobacteriaceae bacterium]
MKIKFLITILLITISIYSQEEQTSFTLEEAIQYALAHNYKSINADRDIAAAKKRKWETTTIGLPQINAKIDYQNFLKQQVSLIPAEFFGGNPGEFAEVTFGTKQNINASATLSQLIFDGSYLVGLQSAKVYLEISENAKEKTDIEVRKAVVSAYGNVLLAEESVKILDKNIATIAQNLFETQKTFENGLTEEENVEQLQITLQSLKKSLNQTKRARNVAYRLLNFTMGRPVEAQINLRDQLEALTLQYLDMGLIEKTFNVESNIDFKIAKNNERSQELLLKLERSYSLPTLSAFVNGAYLGNNDEFRFLNKEQEWFGTSLIGVSLNLPIFSSGKRSAKAQQAKIALDQAKTSLTETEQKLQLDVTNAKINYQTSIDSYETAKSNLNLAERIEKKNEIKFFEGIASGFDLRQAQQQLFRYQQELLTAMIDIINQKTLLETLLNE